MDGAWRIAAASVAGTSHLASGRPCQDAHSLSLADAEGTVLVAAVADGAGSAELSDIGAAKAAWILECAMGLHAVRAPASALTEDVARAFYANVRTSIEGIAERKGNRARDYACTLLGALVDAEGGAFMQLGDGAIAVRMAGSADWTAVTWPQHGEYANETNFVVGGRAEADMAFAYVPGAIEEVALFTDGLENLVLNKATRTAHAPFFEHVAAPVRRLERPGLDAGLSDSLAGYLSSRDVSSRTDDDVTLVIASRGAPA